VEGSIINQIEISGFNNEKEAKKFQKRIKSFKSVFNLNKIDKSINFLAEEASWKIKEDFSIVYLFITEETFPEDKICKLSKFLKNLNFEYLIISPSQIGHLIFLNYCKGLVLEKKEIFGKSVKMLGDLIKGGFN